MINHFTCFVRDCFDILNHNKLFRFDSTNLLFLKIN